MPPLDELRARLLLLRAAEPPALATNRYIADHGPLETAEHIRNGTALAAVLSEITRPDARIDDDLRALDDDTTRLLTPEDPEFRIHSPCCPRSSCGSVRADAGRVAVVLDRWDGVPRSESSRCVV